MLIVWLKFSLCAVIIYLAGSRLSQYGDAIAEKTGLCRAWIGLVLLAAITSLPELATAVSASAVALVPDLAAGDLLGACMMNMFSLALLDLIWGLRGKGTIFIRPKPSNLASTIFGVLILLIVAMSLSLGRVAFDPSFAGISVYSFIILGIYLLSLWVIYGQRERAAEAFSAGYEHVSSAQVYFFFALSAVIVVVAGSWLPFIGNEIVAVMGWGQTFVGVLFLALATTLPELTVSFSALRLGHFSMAVGNMVGSNVFDVSLVFIADIFYRPASLYSSVNPAMIFAALSGAVLMGLLYYTMKRQVKKHWTSILTIVLYLVSLFLLFRFGALS
ncbi:MAG: sodium:calcium antiporter [Candidatus Saganbacteria bacterium]|nr:sodium:calcium antiporter [Candidatus Saganbacteria bacterium]